MTMNSETTPDADIFFRNCKTTRLTDNVLECHSGTGCEYAFHFGFAIFCKRPYIAQHGAQYSQSPAILDSGVNGESPA